MFAVPLDRFRSSSVEDETNRVLSVVPDPLSDIVTVTEFIGEAISFAVEKKSSTTTESFGGEEFDLGVRFVGINQGCWVHLHFV